MSALIEAILNGISTGIGTASNYGIWWGIGAFILVMLVFVRKKHDDEKIKQLSEEEQLKIQYRHDNIETAGCLIGGLGAVIITAYLIYISVWG